MATKRIKLPRRKGKTVKNPFAAYLNSMPKVGLEPDIAEYYSKLAAKTGCDLTTMINDVLQKGMVNDQKHKRRKA